MSSNNLNHSNLNVKDLQSIIKNERFAKLSEKIAQIQNTEILNPSNKFHRLEHKLDEVEDNFTSSIQSLELKYSLLKDQLGKFTKIVEDERATKEKIKNKTNEELKIFENKIKSMLLEEREQMKNYVDSSIKHIDNRLSIFEKNNKTETENIRENLIAFKEYIDTEIPSINQKIETEVEDRRKILHNLVNEMNGEFSKVHELVLFF